MKKKKTVLACIMLILLMAITMLFNSDVQAASDPDFDPDAGVFLVIRIDGDLTYYKQCIDESKPVEVRFCTDVFSKSRLLPQKMMISTFYYDVYNLRPTYNNSLDNEYYTFDISDTSLHGWENWKLTVKDIECNEEFKFIMKAPVIDEVGRVTSERVETSHTMTVCYSENCPVGNSFYTVLDPGVPGLDPLVIYPHEGGINKTRFSNYEAYWYRVDVSITEEIGFHLGNFCPSGLQVPEGKLFDGWLDEAGNKITNTQASQRPMNGNVVKFTAIWKDDPVYVYGPIGDEDGPIGKIERPKEDDDYRVIHIGDGWNIAGESDKAWLMEYEYAGYYMTWEDAKKNCDTIYNEFTDLEKNAVIPLTKNEEKYAKDICAAPLDNQNVFLLSLAEEQYYNYGNAPGARFPYRYWLRSAVDENDAWISHDYASSSIGRMHKNESLAVSRPAFLLDKSAVLFLSSSGDNGYKKPDVDSGFGAFMPYDEYDSHNGRTIGYKMTMIDESRNSFKAEVADTTINPAHGIKISYSGAKTGERECISAMLCSEDGEPLYASTVSEGTGIWNLPVPRDIKPGNYTLKVFSEQRNSYNRSDYASRMTEIPITVTEGVYDVKVSIFPEGGGTAKASVTSGPKGTEVTLSATPNEGYDFPSWSIVSGDDISIENDRFEIGTMNVEVRVTFKRDISGAETIAHASRVYNGEIQWIETTKFDVIVDGKYLNASSRWPISIKNRIEEYEGYNLINAGQGVMLIEGRGNYYGVVPLYFTIEPKPLTSAMFSIDQNSFVSDGKYHAPVLTVLDAEIDSENPLVLGKDYIIEEGSVTSAAVSGSYEIKVKGIGNYSGSFTFPWTITPDPQYNFAIFNVQGNGTAPDSQALEANEFMSRPKDPEEEGYQFTGWYKEPECENEWIFDFDRVDGDTMLYAGWKPVFYNVTFTDGEDNILKTESIQHGKTATAPEAPSREGYTFEGWDTDFSCVKAELTVKAIWKEVKKESNSDKGNTNGNSGNTPGGNSGNNSGNSSNGNSGNNSGGSSGKESSDKNQSKLVNTSKGVQYFKEDGSFAKNEWVKINDTWYYFNSEGYVASNEWVEGKWINADGSCTYSGLLTWNVNSTGWWVEDSEGWYPVSQWQKIDGIWYYFNDSGYMASNEYYNGYWFNADGSWDDTYYLTWKSNSTGWWVEDKSGWWPSDKWLKIDGCWYYFDSSGYMVTNQYVDGYWIGADGVCN